MDKLTKGDSCIFNQFVNDPDKIFSTFELNKITKYSQESIRNSLSKLFKLKYIIRDLRGFYQLNKTNVLNYSIFNDNEIKNEELLHYLSKILDDHELPKIHGLVLKKINIDADYDKLTWEVKGGDKAKFYQYIDELGQTTIRLHRKSSESDKPSLRIDFSQENNKNEKNPLDLYMFSNWKNKVEGILKATFNSDIQISNFRILELGIGKDTEALFFNKEINMRFKLFEDTIIECYTYQDNKAKSSEMKTKMLRGLSLHLKDSEEKPINNKVGSFVDIMMGLGKATEILSEQESIKKNVKELERNQQFNNEHLEKLHETNKELLKAIPKINEFNSSINDNINDFRDNFKDTLKQITNKSVNQVQILESELLDLKDNVDNDVNSIYHQLEQSNYFLKKSIQGLKKLIVTTEDNFQQYMLKNDEEKKEINDILRIALDNQKQIINMQNKKKHFSIFKKR